MELVKNRKRAGNQYRPAWSDWEVELCRKLRDAGLTYRSIAEKMDVPLPTVRKWCQYASRCDQARRRRRVRSGP